MTNKHSLYWKWQIKHVYIVIIKHVAQVDQVDQVSTCSVQELKKIHAKDFFTDSLR